MGSFVILFAVAVLVVSTTVLADQPNKFHRIGVLNEAWSENHPAVEGLKDGLREQGFREGRNLAFDIRFTEGDPGKTKRAAAALVNTAIDLIFTSNEAATKAALEATRRIPIVFTLVGDPVAAGIVRKLSRPGGNATGISGRSTELVRKRLEILKMLAPTLRRVWAIYYAGDPSSLAAIQTAREVAPVLSLELLPRPVRTTQEVVTVLQSVHRNDGLLPPPLAILDIPVSVLEASLSRRIPAVFHSAFWVRYGALASYGADYYDEGFQAARLVAKILRGASTSDLPVERANRIELAVNLKTSKQFGMAIPPSVLFRANEIVK